MIHPGSFRCTSLQNIKIIAEDGTIISEESPGTSWQISEDFQKDQFISCDSLAIVAEELRNKPQDNYNTKRNPILCPLQETACDTSLDNMKKHQSFLRGPLTLTEIQESVRF